MIATELVVTPILNIQGSQNASWRFKDNLSWWARGKNSRLGDNGGILVETLYLVFSDHDCAVIALEF